MNVHIISIGDELLIGQTVNTNVSYIGEQLTKNQFVIVKSSVIGDSKEAILFELKSASNNADIIIITGGLGPTHDDITRDCIVEFFNSELVFNKDVLQDIKSIFGQRGKKLTLINEDQANLPKIAEAIRNERGTAPGMWIKNEGKIFVIMPGVPFEMKGMMENYVLARLIEEMGELKTFSNQSNLLTTGIPESLLYEKLGDIEEILNGSKLAFLPNQFGVKLRITAQAENEEKTKDKLVEIEQIIRTKVGRYIYGKEDDSLEEVIAKILTERELNISIAESCTGGLISYRLTNINGSSSYYNRGTVTYSNAAKVEFLKVSEDTLVDKGAVSLEVAMQMAEGIKAVSGSDIGLSVTGVMGPTGGTYEKPVGLVYIGICDEKICSAKEYRFGTDRLLNKDRTSQAALEMLRRHLLGISYDE